MDRNQVFDVIGQVEVVDGVVMRPDGDRWCGGRCGDVQRPAIDADHQRRGVDECGECRRVASTGLLPQGVPSTRIVDAETVRQGRTAVPIEDDGDVICGEDRIAELANQFVRQIFAFARRVSFVMDQDGRIFFVVGPMAANGREVFTGSSTCRFRGRDLVSAEFRDRCELEDFEQASSDFGAGPMRFGTAALVPFQREVLIVRCG